ncbi:MAG TPA: GFA family protein [Roseomonas sp.]|jgi:hypothetical protein
MTIHEGGCICGAVRYETLAEPLRVTTCHCQFCQRATGSAYMVEPIFRREDLRVTKGSPATYEHRSGGSGKLVHIHFCATCGTKLYLSFERFPTSCGVYAGTFDDPDWFEINPENAKHIFVEVARHETILPPGIPAFGEHAMRNDGAPQEPAVFAEPRVVGRRSTGRGIGGP